MAKSNSTSLLSRRYASALFELAQDEKAVDAVEADLATLVEALEQSEDLQTAIRNPILKKNQVGKAIQQIVEASGSHILTVQLCALLAENRRLALIPGIYAVFREQSMQARGELAAEIYSAHKLSATEKKDIMSKLKTASGFKIQIADTVKPELLGGLQIKLGSKLLDDSLASKLDRIGRFLKTG